MKVILIYSNVMKETWVPIGLLYIASNLRKNNIDVRILDSKYDNILKEIDEYKPNIVGLGGMTIMAYDAIKWGKLIDKDYEHYDHKKVTYIPNGLNEKIMLDTVKKGCKN